MSHLDSEITSLRLRIASLEEEKRKESEHVSEIRESPVKTLEGIVTEKRKQIERNNYAKSIPLARFYDQEKLSFLEPILSALKNIQERLEVLEKKE